MQGDSMNRLALLPSNMLIGHRELIGMFMEMGSMWRNNTVAR